MSVSPVSSSDGETEDPCERQKQDEERVKNGYRRLWNLGLSREQHDQYLIDYYYDLIKMTGYAPNPKFPGFYLERKIQEIKEVEKRIFRAMVKEKLLKGQNTPKRTRSTSPKRSGRKLRRPASP